MEKSVWAKNQEKEENKSALLAIPPLFNLMKGWGSEGADAMISIKSQTKSDDESRDEAKAKITQQAKNLDCAPCIESEGPLAT